MNPTEIIGNCHLYLGDCREILPSLPKVDLVLTDPPYGINFAAQPTMQQRASGFVPMDWDKEAPVFIDQIITAGEYSIVWGGNYFGLPASRCFFIWDKGNSFKDRSFAECEMAWSNLDANAKILKFQHLVEAKGYEHPTQKPVRVIEWCLNLAPKTTSTVLDPFAGSGTTGVACANMGKTFYGIEREPKYFDIACKRIEQAYAQQRLFA